MATKKTGNGPVARKAPTKNYRSADAAEGAAKRKAAARVKSTGQTASSSMDAVTRRYKQTSESGRKDRVSGVERNTKNNYRWVDDRKTAARVGGLTGYAAKRSADKRAAIESNRLGGTIMSAEAKAYERKLSSAPKRPSVNPKTKKKRTSK